MCVCVERAREREGKEDMMERELTRRKALAELGLDKCNPIGGFAVVEARRKKSVVKADGHNGPFA